MAIETEIEGGRGSERRDPEHRVFEQPKREDAADRIALAGSGPAHTFASLMIAAGVNVKAISTYMGHARVKITLDTYGHLMPNSEEEAASRLDEYLARAS